MKKTRPTSKIGRKRRTLGWTLLTLGLLVAVVWAASAEHYFVRIDDRGGVGVQKGTALFSRRWGDWGPTLMHEIVEGRVPAVIRLPSKWRWWCWGVRGFELDGGPGCIEVMFPIWPIPLLLWTPAAVLLRSGILARRRAMTGGCAKCGYSLAGLAADSPCPECGKAKATA